MCPFVSDFLDSVSAKYYLNWFTVGKVITEIIRVNFLLRHSVYMKMTKLCCFNHDNPIYQLFERNLHRWSVSGCEK